MRDAYTLPDFSKRVSTNTLLRVVFNADLRNSHKGLSVIAKKLGQSTADLKVGEFLVFVNSSKNMVKLFAAGNTVAHFKTPSGRQINQKVLAAIPRFFNGGKLNYDGALEEVIKKELRL